jgi:hypothetical protein
MGQLGHPPLLGEHVPNPPPADDTDRPVAALQPPWGEQPTD